jgi:four helix bundle protein
MQANWNRSSEGGQGDKEMGRQGDGLMKIESHRELEVYCKAFEAAAELFEYSKAFPTEERYSLTDQLRRSSRSVCANLAEAWRKRRYKAAFISKLSDAEAEAAETQVWIEFAVRCGYLGRELAASLYRTYDEITRMIVAMINRPQTWIINER